jgi:hypothetical protein
MYISWFITFEEIGPTSVFSYVYNVHEASSLRTFGSSGNLLFTIGYGPRRYQKLVIKCGWRMDNNYCVISCVIGVITELKLYVLWVIL